MKTTMLYGPRVVRFETLDDPKILQPTDAILRLAATCVCGSDLWPYRGAQPIEKPTPMGQGDQSRKGVRPDAASLEGGGRLQGDGRAARDQGAVDRLSEA